jgi:hypothetical protein
MSPLAASLPMPPITADRAAAWLTTSAAAAPLPDATPQSAMRAVSPLVLCAAATEASASSTPGVPASLTLVCDAPCVARHISAAAAAS